MKNVQQQRAEEAKDSIELKLYELPTRDIKITKFFEVASAVSQKSFP